MPALPGVRFELRFPYIVTISSVPLEHVHKVRINIETEPEEGFGFDEIGVVRKGSAVVDLDTYAQTYLGLITDMYATTVDFLAAQLWRGAVGSDDMLLVSIADFVAVGTGSSVTASNYNMATVRCFDGSILKVALQETSLDANYSVGFPTSSTIWNDLVAHITGDGSGVLSRQGGIPLAGNKLSAGQNEATWRRRNRF